ncbi:MAG: transglutaminase domain-containing protein, partial [Chloroflexi bacterium]|nr:transglutaminase domain-containing protein [Chloroflexota bacterium]
MSVAAVRRLPIVFRPRGPATAFLIAAVALALMLGVAWGALNWLDEVQSDGPPGLLAPAPSFRGNVSWRSPGIYAPYLIAGAFAALSVVAAIALRRRKIVSLLVLLAGTAAALAIAVPASPVRGALGGGASPRVTGLPGPFEPWMVVAFLAWVVALLGLALISDRHSWALFFYALLWTFWIPPLLSRDPASLGIQQPVLDPASEARQLLDTRLGQKLAEISGLALENGARVTASPNGAVSLSPGMSASQASRPPSLPVFRVQGAGKTSYLRMGTGDIYESGKWQSFDPVSVPYSAGSDLNSTVDAWAGASGRGAPTSVPAGIDPGLLVPVPRTERGYEADVDVLPPPGTESLSPGTVPVSAFMRSADVSGEYDPVNGTFDSASQTKRYEWRAAIPAYKNDELMSAKVADAPAYLQLPEDLPPRVEDLADQITRYERTPYARARAIERYLRSNYVYGFADEEAAPGAPALGQDPVDWFLFDHKRGTCGNFSSAFVVLARAAGLPSRTVSGWAISPTDSEQTVRTDQAHQWAEVAFSPLGWVAFDPTPPEGVAARTEESGGTSPVARELGEEAPPLQGSALARDIQPALPTPTVLLPGAATGPSTGPAAGLVLPPVPPPASDGSSDSTGGADISPPGDLPRPPADLPVPPVGGGTGSGIGSGTSGTGGTGIPGTGGAGGLPGGMTPPPGLPPPTGTGPGGSPGPRPSPTPSASPTPRPPGLIDTTTEITGIDPPRLRTGQVAFVEGVVAAANGAVVSGLKSEIFINTEKANGGTLVGTGSVTQSRFRVQILVPSELPVGKYQVIAHTAGNNRFAESWSDPEIEVFSGTNILLRGPADPLVGEAARFSGSLTTEGGQPIEGAEVAVQIGDARYGATTDRDGEFGFEHTFRQAGSYELVATFAGRELNLPKTATLAVVARSPVEIQLEWPLRFAAGSGAQLKGLVRLRSGEALADRPLKVLVDGAEIARIKAGPDGRFQRSLPTGTAGRHRLEVVHETEALLATARSGGDFQVLAQPRLELRVPSKAGLRDAITVSGSLRDAGGRGIEGKQMRLISAVATPGAAEVATGSDGAFSADFSFESTGTYEVFASFGGDDGLAPAQASARVEISKSGISFTTIGMIVVAIAAGAALGWIGAVFARRRMAGGKPLDDRSAAAQRHPKDRAAEPASVVSPAISAPRAETRLEISLPDIEADLPAVWGVGD